ncbi:nucleotide exchange factor GrpE [Candidatus Poribacteria bacterium]|nr:nucleotide exchange factor GrpE [Candidatus Poribacteria bacterium]
MEYLMTGNEEKTTEEENLDQTDSINSDPPESGNSDESDNEDSVNVIMLSAEEYEQLKNAKAESDEKQKQMLYKMAEYDNLKKRADREKKDFLKYANESLVKDLVPVLDSIDQAVGAAQEAEIETAEGFTALREGVELIQKQLLGSLEKRGVSVIDTEGEIFDPQKHEAVSMAPSDNVPQNNIIQAFQKGYTLHDRVIRPSMVVVSNGNPVSTDNSSNSIEEKEQIENE